MERAAQAIPVPDAVLEQHIGILGKTGSGKSNAAKTMVEYLMRSGKRVCAIDPTGTWWGLRVRGNGKEASDLKPIIFGGVHADIAIEPAHGAIIAEAVGTSSDSAIIDTRAMSVNGRTQFFRDFAEALLRTNKGILELVVDEAHLFAPKGKINSVMAGEMLSATNNLISLGRGIGIRALLISQRPAKLHNDVLSCIETLIAMRLLLPHDRDAVRDWIREEADIEKGKAIIASLSSLKQGDAWVWSPQIEMLKRVHFPLAATLDTGSVQMGDMTVTLSPIDVEAIGTRLQRIRGDVLANDPKTLKRRIAELEKTVAAKPAPAEPSAEAIDAAAREGFNRGFGEGVTDGIGIGITWARDALAALPMPERAASGPTPAPPSPTIGGNRVVPAASPSGLSPSAAKLVNVIIGIFPQGATLTWAAKRAGLSPRSSAFGRYLKEAAADPRLELRPDGRYKAKSGEPGLEVPNGLEEFKAKLPPSYAAILSALEASAAELDLDQIAEQAGISRTSSGLTAGLRELVELGLAERHNSTWRMHPDFR